MGHSGGRTLWLVLREAYIQHLRTRSPNSEFAMQVSRVLDRFTRYRNLSSRTLDAITNRDLEEYVRRRREDRWRGKPIKTITLNNEIDILNSVFRFGGPREASRAGRGRLGLMDLPPWYDPLPDEEEPSPVALTVEQIGRFLAVAVQSPLPRCPRVDREAFWTTAISLALVGALRRRALLTVPRPDEGTLVGKRLLPVPAACSKTRRFIQVPLTADIAEMCSRLPSAVGEPLLPWWNDRGQAMTLKYFSEAIRDMQRRAGIAEAERVRIKDFRSTAATVCLEDFSETVAKRRLGHAPGSKVLHVNYVQKRITDAERAASERLAAMVTAQVALVLPGVEAAGLG